MEKCLRLVFGSESRSDRWSQELMEITPGTDHATVRPRKPKIGSLIESICSLSVPGMILRNCIFASEGIEELA